MDWLKLAKSKEQELISELQALLQIESVLDEDNATAEAPFGQGPLQALQFMLAKGESAGMRTKNVDNMAGVIPGLGLTGILVIAAIFYAKRNGFKGDKPATMAERGQKSLKAIWGALLPVIILGSIYTGVVTPTESAVIAVFYGLIVSAFIYRELKLKDLRHIIVESINITAMIFLIVAAASLFGLFLTNAQVPQEVGRWISDSDMNKWVFMITVNILFFIMGMFLEAVSIILITLPILLPILYHFDINLIHFAIIMTINMELGMITPPVGLNLFVVSGIAKEKLGEVVKGVIPFIVIMIMFLVVVILFPQMSLWLPEFMKN